MIEARGIDQEYAVRTRKRDYFKLVDLVRTKYYLLTRARSGLPDSNVYKHAFACSGQSQHRNYNITFLESAVLARIHFEQ